jgi:tetratricopeptide (TPR) repeat protein
VILTRLELFVQSRNLALAELARLSGYTPVHLRRLRADEISATRSGVLAVTGAARTLSRERVRPGMLFERADAFLRGRGHRLSEVHRQDREALNALLAQPVTSHLPERVRSAGIASEAAVRHLLRSGRACLDTAPAAALAIYEAAASVAATLPDTPGQLAASLEAHAYREQAEALKMIGSFEAALSCLATSAERFGDVGLCTDETARVDYSRAAILYDLELWDDALPLARSARRAAIRSGNNDLAANAEQVEAAVLFERGDSDEAFKRWLRLSKVLHPARNPREEEDLARVWMNLGMCESHRARPADALRWLGEAERAFQKLNNTAELARTRWNVATCVRKSEGPVPSLPHFQQAFRAFGALEIWIDAGCVGLEMIEASIDAGIPDAQLTREAGDVADAFARLPYGDALRSGLDDLRRIAGHKDPHRAIRAVRAALRNAKARCTELSLAPLAAVSVGKAG